MRQFFFCLVPALLLPLCGCGGGGPTMPVTGIVIVDGEPLPGAKVTFIPDKDSPGLGGVAETGSDGKFVILGAKGEKGLQPGRYKVTVSKGVLKNPADNPEYGAIIEEIDLKDELPPIYSNAAQTILVYTVADGQPIEIKIDTKKKK